MERVEGKGLGVGAGKAAIGSKLYTQDDGGFKNQVRRLYAFD